MSQEPSPAPSPNFDARAPGKEIDILLIHYTGMRNGDAALDRLQDPTARVSAHYMIEEDGRVFALVDEAARAWHAGVSFWAGETDVNSRAIGIELVNPGHDLGYRDFPDSQMAALIELSQNILDRHPIPAWRVLGHSDVAPDRKQDPGERFDWARLANAGIGLYPPDDLEALDPPAQEAFRDSLARFGYRVEGAEDAAQALSAFRRHFRPDHLSGAVDGIDAARLNWLISAMPGG